VKSTFTVGCYELTGRMLDSNHNWRRR
jgi:hypothetical protein